MSYRKVLIIVFSLILMAFMSGCFQTEAIEEGTQEESRFIKRAELIALFTEFTGVKDTAKEYKGASTYKDLDKEALYYSYVAYGENEGWLDGQENFYPNDLVSKDFVEELAFRVTGIEIPIEVENENSVTKGEVFVILWDLLNVSMENDNNDK